MRRATGVKPNEVLAQSDANVLLLPALPGLAMDVAGISGMKVRFVARGRDVGYGRSLPTNALPLLVRFTFLRALSPLRESTGVRGRRASAVPRTPFRDPDRQMYGLATCRLLGFCERRSRELPPRSDLRPS